MPPYACRPLCSLRARRHQTRTLQGTPALRAASVCASAAGQLFGFRVWVSRRACWKGGGRFGAAAPRCEALDGPSSQRDPIRLAR
eukprot:1405718-Pleurochrysis_carterae.AAC.1